MLARGVLCRLAADVPKTSTHDLPQLAHLLQRSALSRNALTLPALCALSRAYKVVTAESRRSYASTTSATQPTATVKKAVKKTAAKKPTPRKKTASKTTKKKATAKKAKPRKKKAVAKPKRAKKVLTAEQKEKRLISELRKKALKEPISRAALSAYNAFVGEGTRAIGERAENRLKELSQKFKDLTPAEREASISLAHDLPSPV
jgi:hypothetical protein